MEEEISTVNSLMVDGEDREIEDTVARARAEAAQEAAEAAQEAAGAGIVTEPVWVQHRNTYRGKYLGDEYTEEQKAMVAAGTFDDLYIGDYWTINGVDWLIADINYWLGTGDNGHTVTIPHLAIVPRNILGRGKMNDTASTSGGYAGNKLNLSAVVNPIIENAFGVSNILSIRQEITNAVSNGVPTSVIWLDYNRIIMNENMVYGSKMQSSMSSSTSKSNNGITIDKTQLSLFRLNPSLIGCGESYWLRDIVSSDRFAAVAGSGDAGDGVVTGNLGIRTVHGIIG